MKSLGLTDSRYAGFDWMLQGLIPPPAPPNTIEIFGPTAITTQSIQEPGTVGSPGQAWVIDTVTTDVNGNPIQNMEWGTAGGGGVEAQTNGVDNANCTGASCPLVNLQNGTGTTVVNPSGGIWQVNVASAPQASNPSAPTVTPQGTTGATTYCYKIVGNERYDFSVQSAASVQGCTTTGNATLTSVNSNLLTAYADTLYAYRNLSVYRVTGGATQGLIAAGVGKKFTDTGLAGDGSTPTAINTTALDQHCLGSANPVGINVIPGAPCGVDAPPTSPNALDDEMGASFGAPGDVNNTVWTWVTQGSCTASWTSGLISISCPTDAGAAYHCLMQTAPGTPYTFKGLSYWTNIPTANETGIVIAGVAFRESSTGKTIIFGAYSQNTNHPAEVAVSRYTGTGVSGGPTTLSSQLPVGIAGTGISGNTYSIQNTGANTVYTYSSEGVVFPTVISEAKNTFFTTGPDQVGICVNAFAGATTLQSDYWRKTQ
jgi:hypothetical protein